MKNTFTTGCVFTTNWLFKTTTFNSVAKCASVHQAQIPFGQAEKINTNQLLKKFICHMAHRFNHLGTAFAVPSSHTQGEYHTRYVCRGPVPPNHGCECGGKVDLSLAKLSVKSGLPSANKVKAKPNALFVYRIHTPAQV
jgi:hypothetical protein